MALTVEQTMRLQTLRLAVNDPTIPPEKKREMAKEGILILRQDRVAAQAASTTSRTAKAPINTAAALDGLKALAAKMNAGGTV